MAQIASILLYLHKKGIAHRDLNVKIYIFIALKFSINTGKAY